MFVFISQLAHVLETKFNRVRIYFKFSVYCFKGINLQTSRAEHFEQGQIYRWNCIPILHLSFRELILKEIVLIFSGFGYDPDTPGSKSVLWKTPEEMREPKSETVFD